MQAFPSRAAGPDRLDPTEAAGFRPVPGDAVTGRTRRTLSRAMPAALMRFAAAAGHIRVAGTRVFAREDVYREVAGRSSGGAQGTETNPPDPGAVWIDTIRALGVVAP